MVFEKLIGPMNLYIPKGASMSTAFFHQLGNITLASFIAGTGISYLKMVQAGG